MSYFSDILAKTSFPKSVFSLGQDEIYGQDSDHLPLELVIKKGCQTGKTDEETQLPEDLYGHVFIIAAAGSIELDEENRRKGYIEPAKGGCTSLFNGDGILYRLDFHETSQVLDDTISLNQRSLKTEKGSAWLAMRILKTPDYYLDKAIYERTKQPQSSTNSSSEIWKKLEFKTAGIARVSLTIGTRNQLNTALLRFKLDDGERLLATWDNGRPFEVDPYSLKLIGPVGNDSDWTPMVSPIQQQPLKPILTSAHPVFDPHTGEVFTTNISKTLLTLIKPDQLIRNGTRKLWKLISRLPPPSPKELKLGAENSRQDFFYSWPRRFIFFVVNAFIILPILTVFGKWIDCFLHWIGIDQGKNEIYIIRWKGNNTQDSFAKWKVILPKGEKINQTVHQIGITRDYILLCDTAFKIMPELFVPDFAGFFVHDFLDEIRDFLSYPQLPFTNFYIVSRKALAESPNGQVKAVLVTLPREIAHFEVDYDNEDNQIVLFAANINATDPAEYIRAYDESEYSFQRGATNQEKNDLWYFLFGKAGNIIRNRFKSKSQSSSLPDSDIPEIKVNKSAGHCCAPTDINTLGCYIIDAETGKLSRSHDQSCILDLKRTWALSFPAYKDTRLEHQKIQNIYWGAWGLWNDMLSADIYDMYENYKNRIVPIEAVKYLGAVGIPSSISQIRVSREQGKLPTIQFSDNNFYEFPNGYFGTSPTFVPKVDSVSDDDGYIVCTVIYSDNYDSIPDSPSSNWSQNSEIWIFDTHDLHQGPLYCLSHPKLNFGLTIHTTWLESLPSRARDDYDVELDYQKVKQKVEQLNVIQKSQLSIEIDQLFKNEVFPHFKQ